MSDSPRLSIIVPHKDSEALLLNLLSTIPDRDDLEIIIIDDHSDRFPATAVESQDNIKALENLPGRHGPGAARNVAMESATGEWILFADCDDYFLPGAFDFIFESMDSDHQVIYFPPTSQHAESGAPGNRHYRYAALALELAETGCELVRYRFHTSTSKLIRRRLLVEKSIAFDETIVAGDIAFSLKVGIHARGVGAARQPIYCITQGAEGGLSSRRSRDYLGIRIDRHINFNEILKAHGLGRYRMSALTLLRQSYRLGMRDFLDTLMILARHRQPIMNHWGYYRVFLRRKLAATSERG